MSRPILIRDLEQTCFACPSQWEGTTFDGKAVYVRLRHGNLIIEVSGKEVYQEYPDGFDGVMSYSELKQHARHLFVWPDECVDGAMEDEGILFDES